MSTFLLLFGLLFVAVAAFICGWIMGRPDPEPRNEMLDRL